MSLDFIKGRFRVKLARLKDSPKGNRNEPN